MQIKNNLKKITSVWTLISCLVSNLGPTYANPAELALHSPLIAASIQPHLQMPHDLAEIQDIYVAPAAQSAPWIYYIQTVHGEPAVQFKIAKLLKYLEQNKKLDHLFVEGAVNDLDPLHFNILKDPQKNQALAHHLVSQGLMTGADYYLLETQNSLPASGLEDADLYRKNLEALRSVFAALPQTENFIRRIHSRLDLLMTHFASPKFRRLLQEWERFEQNRREFHPYLKLLADSARSELNVDLQDLFSQLEWPQLARILALEAAQRSLHASKAVEQKTEILRFLSTRPSLSELTFTLQTLALGDRETEAAATSGPSSGSVTRYWLERFAEETRPYHFDFRKYPDFFLAMGLKVLREELDSRELSREMTLLFNKLLDHSAVSSEQKEILRIYRSTVYLNKLYHLELNREEWDQHPDLNLSELLNSILRLEKSVPKQTKTAASFAGLKNLANLLQKTGEFYALAVRRENSFQDHLKISGNHLENKRYALVTGGFHSEGVKEILKKDGFNYMVLTPSAAVDTDQSRKLYQKSMMQLPPPGFQKSSLETASFLMSPEDQATLGFRSEIRSAQIARALSESTESRRNDLAVYRSSSSLNKIERSEIREDPLGETPALTAQNGNLDAAENFRANSVTDPIRTKWYQINRLASESSGKRFRTNFDITPLVFMSGRRQLTQGYPIPTAPGRLGRKDSVGISDSANSIRHKWMEYRSDGLLYECLEFPDSNGNFVAVVFYYDVKEKRHISLGLEIEDALNTLFKKILSDHRPQRIHFDPEIDALPLTDRNQSALGDHTPTPRGTSLGKSNFFGPDITHLTRLKPRWMEYRKNNRIYLCFDFETAAGKTDTLVFYWDGQDYVMAGNEQRDAAHVKLHTLFDQLPEGTVKRILLDHPLDVTDLTYKADGVFKPGYPLSGWRELQNKKAFGARKNLKQVELLWVERRSDGKIYSCYRYETTAGKRDTTVVREENDTLVSVGTEDEDKVESALKEVDEPQVADFISSFKASGDIDMFLYFLLFVKKFDPKQAKAFVLENVPGLGGGKPWTPHLTGFETIPGSVQMPALTKTDQTVLHLEGTLDGADPATFTHILIEEDRSQFVRVHPDGKFHFTLRLAPGEKLRLKITPYHAETKVKGTARWINVEQTSKHPDLAETLHRLICQRDALKKTLLDHFSEDSFPYKYMQKKMEVTLLKEFMEDPDSAFKNLERKAKPALHAGSGETEPLPPAVRKFYKNILEKFEAARDFFKNHPDLGLKPEYQNKTFFYQRYALCEITRLMEGNIFELNSEPQKQISGLMLALEQGLGKTLVSLILARMNPDGALIITPHALTTNWVAEEGKFFEHPRAVLMDGDTSTKTRKLKTASPGALRIVNLDYLQVGKPEQRTKRLAALNAFENQLVIFDESQFLRNSGSQQSQTAQGIRGRLRLFVSATPISSPENAQPVLAAVTQDKAFQNRAAFQEHLLDAEGPDALRLLHFMFQPYMVRILEQHVFGRYDDQTPLDQQQHRLPNMEWVDPETLGRFEYTFEQSASMLELLVDWPSWSDKKTARNRSRTAIDTLDDQERRRQRKGKPEGLAKLQALKQLGNNPRYAGLDQPSPKAAKAAEIVALEAGERKGKVLIFTSYKQEVQDYRTQFQSYGAVSYYGDTGKDGVGIGPHHYTADREGYLLNAKGDRQKFQKINSQWTLTANGIPKEAGPEEEGFTMRALDYNRLLFQNNPDTKVMIVTYETGAFGATFTEADAAIFDDPPRDYLQLYHAAKRNNRTDPDRRKLEQRYYSLTGKYPERFLESLRNRLAVVNRETGEVSYCLKQDLPPKMKDPSRFHIFDLEEEFRRGTYDEVQFRNLERQRHKFSLVMNGFLTSKDLELMTNATLKESIPLLFQKTSLQQVERKPVASAAIPLSEVLKYKNNWISTARTWTDDELLRRARKLKRAQIKLTPRALGYAIALFSIAAERASLDPRFSLIAPYIGKFNPQQGLPSDSQIEAALKLLRPRSLAVMEPSEGKSLTLGLTSYLKALSGNKVEVHDWNTYLSARNGAALGAILHRLDMTVGVVCQNYFLSFRTENNSRYFYPHLEGTRGVQMTKYQKRAFFQKADIVYGPYDEMIFLWLGDWTQPFDVRQSIHATPRPKVILIDEADTPLVEAGHDSLAFFGKVERQKNEIASGYKSIYHFAEQSQENQDFKILRGQVQCLPAMEMKLKKLAASLPHYFHQHKDIPDLVKAALEARNLFERDHDYVVHQNRILTLDAFTGEIKENRRWARGIHTFLEIKEGLPIREETQIHGVITPELFYNSVTDFSGVIGILDDKYKAFISRSFPGISFHPISPSYQSQRRELPPCYFKTEAKKHLEVVRVAEEVHFTERPILIFVKSPAEAKGLLQVFKSKTTSSVQRSIRIIDGLPGQDEMAAWRQMGAPGAITIATQMAERGSETKIEEALTTSEESWIDPQNGIAGLYMLSTFRSASETLDAQMARRTGRRGQPGVVQFMDHIENNDYLKTYLTPAELDQARDLAGKMETLAAQDQKAQDLQTRTPASDQRREITGQIEDLIEQARQRQWQELTSQQRNLLPYYERLANHQFRMIEAMKTVKPPAALCIKFIHTYVDWMYQNIARGDFKAFDEMALLVEKSSFVSLKDLTTAETFPQMIALLNAPQFMALRQIQLYKVKAPRLSASKEEIEAYAERLIDYFRENPQLVVVPRQMKFEDICRLSRNSLYGNYYRILLEAKNKCAPGIWMRTSSDEALRIRILTAINDYSHRDRRKQIQDYLFQAYRTRPDLVEIPREEVMRKFNITASTLRFYLSKIFWHLKRSPPANAKDFDIYTRMRNQHQIFVGTPELVNSIIHLSDPKINSSMPPIISEALAAQSGVKQKLIYRRLPQILKLLRDKMDRTKLSDEHRNRLEHILALFENKEKAATQMIARFKTEPHRTDFPLPHLTPDIESIHASAATHHFGIVNEVEQVVINNGLNAELKSRLRTAIASHRQHFEEVNLHLDRQNNRRPIEYLSSRSARQYSSKDSHRSELRKTPKGMTSYKPSRQILGHTKTGLRITSGKIPGNHPQVDLTTQKINSSSGILLGFEAGLLEAVSTESPAVFAAVAAFKLAAPGDQKTVAALMEALRKPETKEESIWRTAIPVSDGIGSVVHISDRLPSEEEQFAMRLALRNPNHQETWIVLGASSNISQIASARQPMGLAMTTRNNAAIYKTAESPAQLVEILKSLSHDQFKIMAKLAVQEHQPRPNAGASFVLAAPSEILDQIDTARLGAFVIETPDQINPEKLMAQHLLTADIADELHQAEDLREQTLQNLVSKGSRYEIKPSALDIFTAKIETALAQTSQINRSA